MQHNEDTTNKRTRLDEAMLKDAVSILTAISNACTDTWQQKVSFSQACRKYGLEPLYTRNLILSFLGKCTGTKVDLSTMEFDLYDSCERFYRAVFGDKALTEANLPVDYRESVRYVVNETGLSEREARVLTGRFGLDDEQQRTLSEVGEEITLSHDRVRQIEAGALRKCRAYPRRNILKYGLSVYMVMKEQREEKARIELEQMRAEHQAAKEDMARKHEERMSGVKDPETLTKQLKEIDIDNLDLTVRSYNCLRRRCIYNLYDLAGKDMSDLLKTRNLGSKCAGEIMEKLEGYLEHKWGITQKDIWKVLPELKALPEPGPKEHVLEEPTPEPICKGSADTVLAQLARTTIHELGFKATLSHPLVREGIYTVFSLIRHSGEDLTKIRNLGAKTVEKIKIILETHTREKYGRTPDELRARYDELGCGKWEALETLEKLTSFMNKEEKAAFLIQFTENKKRAALFMGWQNDRQFSLLLENVIVVMTGEELEQEIKSLREPAIKWPDEQ